MEAYRDFPVWIVLYNLVTFGGVLIMGVIVTAQLPAWAFIAYLVLLAVVAVFLPATVCVRCGYYGHRCAMGIGGLVAAIFRKHAEDEFFRTKTQFLVVGLYLFLLILPVAGAVALLVSQSSTSAIVQLIVVSGLLVLALAPHTKLACAHCSQGECGMCPLGRIIWKRT